MPAEFKHFELLQTAADETYTKAHASQFPDTTDVPSTLGRPRKGQMSMSGFSSNPLDLVMGESIN